MHNQVSGQNKFSAFDTATYLLSFKDRTEKEINSKLTEKGYSVEEIDEAIRKLKEYGYLNDRRYALSYIESTAHKKGIRLIKGELKDKGINKEIIEESIETLDINEYINVYNIYERRFLKYDLKDQKQKRKIMSYFLRRGYSYEIIGKIIKNFDVI